MDKFAIQLRTKQFALRVMKLIRALPKDGIATAIGNQLIRSATSVGANYRSACRSRSRAEFLSKLGVVLEETDESGYWLELIIEGKILPESKVEALLRESEELAAIFYSALKTARKNPKS